MASVGASFISALRWARGVAHLFAYLQAFAFVTNSPNFPPGNQYFEAIRRQEWVLIAANGSPHME